MKFQVRASNFQRDVRRAWQEYRRDVRLAARRATDKAARHAQVHLQRKIRAVGLGRLGGAVGMSSALKKKDPGLWAVIYARGRTNDDSRGASALEAYSQGTIIRARNGTWMAYQTNVIPRTTGAGRSRRRMTPARYKANGWEARLGELKFRPINRSMALLVAKKVTISPRTGLARRAGPGRTRTRIARDEVVVFILIKVTRRAKRFDEKEIVGQHARDVPRFIQDELRQIRRAINRG